MYRIHEYDGGFVVVDSRTGIRESEVYANIECAQEFMAELVWAYQTLCRVLGTD